MPTLQKALERTFLSDKELFGSPLNCSMSGGISYCYAFPEDEIFGGTTDSFRYRWTGSCIANPEYQPEYGLKAVLHALSSSEAQDTPFLVVLILPVWEDTQWNSAAIRDHHNMSTLIRISAGHMCFVPAHKQSDEFNRRTQTSPPQNGRWNSSLTPTKRVKRHLFATTRSNRSRARQSKPHASSLRHKHSSSRPHHLEAGSEVA